MYFLRAFSDHYSADPEFWRVIVDFPHLGRWIDRAVDDSMAVQLYDGTELKLSYRDDRKPNTRERWFLTVRTR